jgi:hypothetical protein
MIKAAASIGSDIFLLVLFNVPYPEWSILAYIKKSGLQLL